MTCDHLPHPSLALLTDLYQLTMAYGYWKNGMAQHEAVFHLFFRRNPFKGGYAIACGLQPAMEYLEAFCFGEEDLAYLATLTGNDEQPLFDPDFLDYLRDLRFNGSVKALPEGTVVFPHEPMLQMRGPLLLCQLMETALLNIMNFQTLIATKAARICSVAGDDPVLEFGLRRAQGIDGSISASRAAHIGGCGATSNVLAGRLFGIPVRGTHAHSWVMAFDSEPEAFAAYAAAMPNNCIFLVDTYDTIEGVRNAVEAGKWLREKGHNMAGIRLDSGDLAALSIEARKLLDEAGLQDAAIVASNDLDEHRMVQLREKGAKISVWGIGTRLVTAFDEPALGGVYKLAAIRPQGGEWKTRIKLSNEPIKVSQPGILQVRRFWREGRIVADMMYDERSDPAGEALISLDGEIISVNADEAADLLVPVFDSGRRVYSYPEVSQLRARARSQLAALPPTIRALVPEEAYPVGLSESLHRRKWAMIRNIEGPDAG